MSDQRSVMKEFRFLDQKRQTTGLSAEESTRYAQLRDLVGPDTAAPPRAGFDVNAAAARLRESLLPGGLRGQAPAAPPEPEPLPAPETELTPEAVALEAAWEAQPFAPLDVDAAPAADPLFDPASLGGEVRPQAWNPDAPGYDPDAPYDEAAWIAAGYDPNATYDWSAYEQAGQAAEGAGPADEAVPEGAVQLDEAEPVAFEEAPAAGPSAWEAPLAEPAAEAAPEPVLEPADWSAPEAVEIPEPELALEPEPGAEALPFDPNAPFDHAKWFGRAPTAQAAPPALDDAPLDPGAEAAAVPELEPLAELTPEPEPEPLAAPPPSEAEAAWAAAVEATPVELAEVPDVPFEEAQGEPTAAAPAEPFAVGAPEPNAAGAAPDLDAAWADAGAMPLDQGGDPALAPILLAEEGDPQAPAPGEEPPAAWFDAAAEPPPAPALAFGDYDGDARGVPAGLAAMMVEPLPEPPAQAADLGDLVGDGSATPYQAAPEGAPFGEYDETAPGSAPALALEEASLDALPFDPAAASAIEPGALPEGYGTGSLALEPAAAPPSADGAEAGFPADAAYGGPEGDSLPGGPPLEVGEPVQDWLPEQALEQGFELASDGSFGELGHPVLTPVPGWATVEEVAAATAAAAPAAGWESPPALDLAAPFDLAVPEAEPAFPPEEPPALDAGEPLAPEAAAEPAFETPDAVAGGTGLEASPEPFADAALEPSDPAAAGPAPEAPAGPPFDLPAEPGAALPADLPAEPLLEAVAPPAEAPLDELPTLGGEDILEELPPAPEPAPPAVEPYQGEIPPEIAAAFGDAPAAADPFAAAVPATGLPPPAAPFGAASLFAGPPPVAPGALAEPEPEPAVEPEPLPGPDAAPQVWIEGSHRVVLHTVDGQVKRGLLVDAALDAVELALQPPGAGAPEIVATDNVKAIFFMLAPGEKAAAPEGKKVRVTFRDGRQVAGYSPDYVEGTIGFFMIPADTRTNTGRIWVYQLAVRQVTVS